MMVAMLLTTAMMLVPTVTVLVAVMVLVMTASRTIAAMVNMRASRF